MTDPRHAHLRRLFDQALDLPAAARTAFLDSKCRDDVELKQRLVAMLAAAEDEQFLSAPTGDVPVAAAPLPAVEAPLREGPGTRIGPYKLLQLIGEGGFGVVFMAEQEQPVARKVALKIIKLGMDTRQVVARFEQERQALAMMDHPNIARVLDAGATETGRPYFVMDLVKGDPIAEYCDKNKLTIDERLELFAQVCHAVQHAHGKGIIHRDIKPTNVLVGTQDGKPMAKVIDFGIAKATNTKLTDKTLFTEHQQVIGTLQYMSPEQAEGSLDIDTRTDVYSLGVLLYELLTGSTPFDKKTIQGALFGELQRMIREVEPPKPSTRLSDSHDTLASIAAQRGVEPKRLGSLVRGELDWIVMKALEKDRSRRYETANGLAMDIRRYLAGEAVVAAPPSASYRLRKFVRRNKATVGTVAAVGLALLAGLIAFAWQANVTAQQRDRAVLAESETKLRADELQQVAAFQANMLEQVDPTRAGQLLTDDVVAKLTAALAKAEVPEAERAAQIEAFRQQWRRVNTTDAARDLIDRTILHPAAEAIDGLFRDQPLVAARLRMALAERYRTLGLYEPAAPLLTSALSSLQQQLGAEHEETLGAMESLGLLQQAQGQLGASGKLLREVLATSRRVLGEEHALTLRMLRHVGDQLQAEGKRPEAEPCYRDALTALRRLRGEQHPLTLSTMSELGVLLWAEDRLAEAEPLLRQALLGQRATLGESDPVTLDTTNHLALVLEDQGKLAEAETMHRTVLAGRQRMLGEEHPATLLSMNNLGMVLKELGRPTEAEALFREAYGKRQRRFGDEHPETLVPLNNLGLLLKEQDRLIEAEPLLRQVLDRRRRLLGQEHPATLTSINNLGTLFFAQRRFADAEPLFREALDKGRRVLGEDHQQTLGLINNLGMLLQQSGRLAEAEPLLREAMQKLRQLVGDQHPNTMTAIANHGAVLMALQRFDEAEARFRQALDLQQRALGSSHPGTVNTLLLLSGLLLDRSRHQEALALLAPNEASVRKAFPGRGVAALGKFLLRLGIARAAVAKTGSEFAAAEANASEANTVFAASESPAPKDLRQCAQTLVDLYTAWDKLEPGSNHEPQRTAWQAKLAALPAPEAVPQTGDKK